MCGVRLPAHLLLFDEPTADDLVDRGLGDRGGYGFAVVAAVCIVGNELAIGFQIGRELVERPGQFLPFGPVLNPRVMLDEFDQRVEPLKASMDIAVPQ